MATPANSIPMPGRPPSSAVVHIPTSVGLEDEFLALQALRERTTARLYEILDILMPPTLIRPAPDTCDIAAADLPRSGLAQTRPGLLLFKGGRNG